MKLCIRAARFNLTFGPEWVWFAWLEEKAPARDRFGNMTPSGDAITVGFEFPDWKTAFRAGTIALRFSDTRWTNNAHGLEQVVSHKRRGW